MRTIAIAALSLAVAASSMSGAAFAQRPLGDKDHDGVPNVIDPHDDRWDPAWGAVVVAPKGWNTKRHWNHHVRLCKEKFRTYDPHRDRYRLHNRWVRCNLY